MALSCRCGKWYLLELTYCYETNISKNISRKAQKYDQLIKDLSTARDIVSMNLVISSIGTIARKGKSLIDMFEQIGLNDNERVYCASQYFSKVAGWIFQIRTAFRHFYRINF